MAMNIGSSGDEDEVVSAINTTPLVDVMLVLLVIFMITAPLMSSSLKLDLPKADGAQPNEAPQFISVALDPQGHIHAVVANLTRDPKGTWKALWNGEIWKNNTTIGQFYHAAFRAQLQKLGYETEAAGKHGSPP